MKATEYEGKNVTVGRGDKRLHLMTPYPGNDVLCGADVQTIGEFSIVDPERRPLADICPRCLRVESGETLPPRKARVKRSTRKPCPLCAPLARLLTKAHYALQDPMKRSYDSALCAEIREALR